MDITNMLNTKGAAAAAAAAAKAGPSSEQQIHQSLVPHSNGHAISETASERGTSPHGSEHSRYSGTSMQHMNGMSAMNSGMRYPSPSAMQTPLPMLQGYRSDSGIDNSMMQHESPQISTRQTSGDATVQKAFPCSSCGKGFARRSDLARHGKCIRPSHPKIVLIQPPRTNT